MSISNICLSFAKCLIATRSHAHFETSVRSIYSQHAICIVRSTKLQTHIDYPSIQSVLVVRTAMMITHHLSSSSSSSSLSLSLMLAGIVAVSAASTSPACPRLAFQSSLFVHAPPGHYICPGLTTHILAFWQTASVVLIAFAFRGVP